MKTINNIAVGCLSALLLATLLIGCGEEDAAAAMEDDSRSISVRGDGAENEETAEELPTLGDTPINDEPAAVPPSEMSNGEPEERIEGLGGGAESGLTCNEIYACFSDCAAGDRPCLDACFQSGTSRAQGAVEAISACVESNQCQDQTCVEESCPNQIAACDAQDRPAGSAAPNVPNGQGGQGNQRGQGNQGSQGSQGSSGGERIPGLPRNDGGQGGQGGQPNGDLLCNEIFDCYAACGQGNQDCIADCYGRGTDSGRRAVDGIGACIHANQCQDQECVTTSCTNQIRICDNDTGVERLSQPNGRDLTCGEIEQCFSQCPPNDERCNDTCYNSGSAEARQALSAVGACIRRFDCQTEACVQNSCAQQIQACDNNQPGAQPGDAGQGPRPPGPQQPGGDAGLECVGIYQCSGSCGEDQNCRRECFERGTVQGQAEATAVSSCVQQNGCRDDECARARCGNEIQACEAPDAGGQAPAEPNPPVNEAPHNAEDDAAPGEADGTCRAPAAINFGQIGGTTSGAPQAERGNCGGGGAESVFSFTVDAATEVCVNTAGSRIDTVLYVRAGDCDNAQAEVACNDDAMGVQSQVALMANPNTTYFVVVDSYNASGEFILNLRQGGCL